MPPKIICPACKSGRLVLDKTKSGEAACGDCKASFPNRDGVIDLLPDLSYRRSTSQKVMEWDFFIQIYESKWFRKGPGFPLISGISFDEEYRTITRADELRSDEVVLDLGCGSGIYSRPLAKRLDRGVVVGLDLSMPMLNYASAATREEGIENFILIRGNGMELPFPEDQFDAAICCATIHLFSLTDMLALFKEVSRVLKPGGTFRTACLRNPMPWEWYARLVVWFQARVGTNYLRSQDLEPVFKEAGFGQVECLHEKRYWILMGVENVGG